jgi:hypothetical protein
MGVNTTTSRGAKVAEVNTTERNWNKDMPAYKRLRANGLQPKRIDGAAEVEKKAQESWQVETGILPTSYTLLGLTSLQSGTAKWLSDSRQR